MEKTETELRILEFQVNQTAKEGTISEGFYGINVLKVQRIINMPDNVVQVPAAHPSIMGIITTEDTSIPIIDLTKSLQREVQGVQPSKVIITEFCGTLHGFAVHSVVRIHNIDWKDVDHPPELVANEKVYTISVVKLKEKVVLLLDFERIVSDINPELGIKEDSVDGTNPDRANKNILIAEDSAFIRNTLKQVLANAGYNVTVTVDGKDAWNTLEEYLLQVNTKGKSINEFVDLIIADLEMPQMDGRQLVRMIKEESGLQEMPIIVFSSLINEDYDKKRDEMGVSAVIGKPKIKELVSMIDKLVL
ncbi:MAG: chemotaxis protein CheV [Candidatus Anammoxibacter sp.]